MPRIGTLPLAVSAAWGSPSRRPVQHPAGAYRGDRFPRSTPEPEPSSRHLYAGHHLGSKQAPPRLIPGQQLDPGFDDAATLSTLHQWFTHVRLLGSHLTPSRAPFPRRSPPRLLTDAARGGLRPPPAGRPRRANLHLQHSTASKDPIFYIEPPSAFVAHNRPHSGRADRLRHHACGCPGADYSFSSPARARRNDRRGPTARCWPAAVTGVG